MTKTAREILEILYKKGAMDAKLLNMDDCENMTNQALVELWEMILIKKKSAYLMHNTNMTGAEWKAHNQAIDEIASMFE